MSACLEENELHCIWTPTLLSCMIHIPPRDAKFKHKSFIEVLEGRIIYETGFSWGEDSTARNLKRVLQMDMVTTLCRIIVMSTFRWGHGCVNAKPFWMVILLASGGRKSILDHVQKPRYQLPTGESMTFSQSSRGKDKETYFPLF